MLATDYTDFHPLMQNGFDFSQSKSFYNSVPIRGKNKNPPGEPKGLKV
jgi:hypothetical protein